MASRRLMLADELESLIIEKRGMLIRIASQILKDRHLAEDTVQRACLNAWAHLSDFRGEARMSTWLSRMVINESIIKARSRKLRRAKRHEIRRIYYLPSGPLTPEQILLTDEIRALFRREINRAPRIFRDALLADLSIIERAEAEPIAALARRVSLGCGAAKTLRARARRWLRGRMQAHIEARAI